MAGPRAEAEDVPEPKLRIRWITREEAETLLTHLPEWLAAMARFALATGLRQANVYGLEWSPVDLKRGVALVHADQAKARRAIGELGGWETLEMVNRPAHLAPERLKAHAARLSLTAQIRHNDDAVTRSDVAVSN